jgi:hypothetical protein
MKRHIAAYRRCDNCGYTFVEDPHWLEEAYRHPINTSDTGILARNEKIRDALTFIFWMKSSPGDRFLDYAGGYGLLTRMMRDKGFDFYWHDPYTENIFAKGFEMNPADRPFRALTCCECYEHFTDPVAELERQCGFSRNIFLTTSLISPKPPAPDDWDYYGFSHGQHVSFYTEESLRILARSFGLNFCSNGRNFHCLGDNAPGNSLMKLAYSPVSGMVQLFARKFRPSRIHSDSTSLKDKD